jgi:formylglycine-generating enzyme required for sulfatase activity
MDILTVAIPSGAYQLGDDSFSTSHPVHTIHLNTFDMARTAISNQQFAEFVRAGGYQDKTLWTEKGWRWQSNKQIMIPHYWQEKLFNRPEQPVVGISWYTAMAFCKWLSQKTNERWILPTEAQWEVAIRGISGDGLTQIETINSAEKGLGYPIAVDKGHIASNGLVNMLGNVTEWTLSRWGHNWPSLDYPYPYRVDDGREDPSGSYARVMRGGSWFDPIQHCHPAYRARYLPGSRGSNIGFRVVRLPIN